MTAEARGRIQVVGVGAGGGRALDWMIEQRLRGVEFLAVDADPQALASCRAAARLRIGGRGGRAETGAEAAEASAGEIGRALYDAGLVLVTTGLGGRTGSGAAPVIARIAREAGALTVGVVSRPFGFEISRRRAAAEAGLEQLQEQVHTLLAIRNDRLLAGLDRRTTVPQAFRRADELLGRAVQGITDLLTVAGPIRPDRAAVQAVLIDGGTAFLAIGEGEGDGRAVQAAERALAGPLADVTLDGAGAILLNVSGGPDLAPFEAGEVAAAVRTAAGPGASLALGVVIDERLAGRVRVTLIATGRQAPARRGTVCRGIVRRGPP